VFGDVGAPKSVRGVGDEAALHEVVVHRRRRPVPAVRAAQTPVMLSRRIRRAIRLPPTRSPRSSRSSNPTRGAS
jgi:hypothetical protein